MKTLFGVLTTVAVLALSPAGASAQITSANVGDLQLKWDRNDIGQVTAAPVLANGLLYVSSWDGTLYALDPDDGSTTWSHDTGAGFIAGIQSTPLVLPNGDVCIGSSLANVTCLDGTTGVVTLGPASVGSAFFDNIWSGLATANDRLIVSVASLLDQPCTQGRIIALDLNNNLAELWTLVAVPENICDTDTTIACTDDSECGADGTCTEARGAGVTATVSFDSTGDIIYMNTVGCYTFPSVGDSDSIFKVDATNGSVIWKTRVDPIEQFGVCNDDNSEDCGRDSDCTTGTCAQACAGGDNNGSTCSDDSECAAGGGVCRGRKPSYHDFGALNGPNLFDTGVKEILITGSKNGTLYALNETDGMIAWETTVRPKPISPGFAGFGLFNGPVTVTNGNVYAALYELIPDRVCDDDNSIGCDDDSECGTFCIPLPAHLQAWNATTGAPVWQNDIDIGPSWSAASVANNVVYAGTNGASEFYAHDATTGARLATFPLGNSTVSKALVDGDSLYIGYGVISPPGGVRAYSLSTAPVPVLPGWGGVALLMSLLLLTAIVVRRRAARVRVRA
jgi:outer membrane protein assembly factor BamB